MTNDPILQSIIVLRPGSFITGFIQNEQKLSSSGSFFLSWQMNSLYIFRNVSIGLYTGSPKNVLLGVKVKLLAILNLGILGKVENVKT